MGYGEQTTPGSIEVAAIRCLAEGCPGCRCGDGRSAVLVLVVTRIVGSRLGVPDATATSESPDARPTARLH